MKKKIYIFITVALLTLTILPIINIQQNKVGAKWKESAILYNADYLLPYINHFLYFLGISTNPNQVIIGKKNWLYLGDDYEKTITVGRVGKTDQDLLLVKNIGLATRSWEQWFRSKGVRNYKVIIGPDKNTIYAEYLPNWALPNIDSVTNNLLANDKTRRYVDTRSALNAAKTEFNVPLYYQTDTHWNSLGAWIAFRAFTKTLASEESLKFLSDKEVHISNINERNGGDLAGLLRLNAVLKDHNINVKIDNKQGIETEQYDFKTNALKSSGGNPMIYVPSHPLLVKSKNALNNRKVLWLRDSFGTALSPYMAATFTETLQLHYDHADQALLAKLVESYRPDYIFITVVERASRGGFFTTLPPPIITNNKKGFVLGSNGSEAGVNSLTKIDQHYKISGADPFFVFELSSPVITKDSPKLFFELVCENKKEPVNVQVFWHTTSTGFNEADSLTLTTITGITGIDLSSIPTYTESNAITSVRIDFDSPKICSTINITNVEFGK